MLRQVAAADIADPALMFGHRGPQRIDERPHQRRIARLSAGDDELVERTGQDRHHFERPLAPQQILQEQHLEFDRMLLPMRQFAGKQIKIGGARRGLEPGGQPLDEKAIGLDGAQRRVEVLAGDRKQMPRPGVRGTEDDEQIGVALLDHPLVGPGKGRAPAMQVDMRAEHARQS